MTVAVEGLGLGISLRVPHIAEVLERRPHVDFFEVISEQFIDAKGPRLQALEQVAEHYPVVMHGLSLSIGGSEPLDRGYLTKIRTIAEKIGARAISDHVCWTGVGAIDTHDLLPLPLTESSLRHVVGRVRSAQDILGRRLILENPSTYMAYKGSSMPEWEFIGRLAEASDCRILLDVNNVFVSARNQRFDPLAYIDSIPPSFVAQIHIGGHRVVGSHLLDTHDQPVSSEVWQIYAHAMRRFGLISTVLEWDTELPPLAALEAELAKAASYRKGLWQAPQNATMRIPHHDEQIADDPELSQIQHLVQTEIIRRSIASADSDGDAGIELVAQSNPFVDGLGIHATAYRVRHLDSLRRSYPLLDEILGDDFDGIAEDYIRRYPPSRSSLGSFADRFASYLQEWQALGDQWDELIADVALFESVLKAVSETLCGQRFLELRHAPYLPAFCRRARIDVRWSGRPSRYVALSREDDELRGAFLACSEAESRFVGAT